MSDIFCACRFERREDFSNELPVQTEECGFHKAQRDAAQAEIADLKGALEATYAKLRSVNETGSDAAMGQQSEIAALRKDAERLRRLLCERDEAVMLLAGLDGFLALITSRDDAPKWLLDAVAKNHRCVDARMFFVRTSREVRKEWGA
jgi:hypothetical protein